MSKHVITRFYRPPEVIVTEKMYDEKVDVWSMGCVFADMLIALYKKDRED